MLKMIKEIPMGVKLSVLFLIGLIVGLFYVNPYFTVAMIMTALTIFSLIRIIKFLTYGD